MYLKSHIIHLQWMKGILFSFLLIDFPQGSMTTLFGILQAESQVELSSRSLFAR